MKKLFRSKIYSNIANLLALDSKTDVVLATEYELLRDLAEQKILSAKVMINQIRAHGIYSNIQDAEFKVFSQFGDDGIIQYLINFVKILDKEKRFVEFGVENYLESNTRFLLFNNNWSGLVMDGSVDNIKKIQESGSYWKYDLKAICKFVTAENISGILEDEKFDKDLGLVHVDIDGNDYWVWNALKGLRPVIIVAEYNSVFGITHPVTIPYAPKFYRTKTHYSNLYWGASLKAYYDLFAKRGYDFVGTNSAGNNAYFVRKDRLGRVKRKSIKEGYTLSKYRESRDKGGNLTYVGGVDRLKVIKEMKVMNLESKRLVKIKDLG